MSMGLLMALFSTDAVSSEISTHYLGTAHDLDSGHVVYTEEYQEYSQNGLLQRATVTYFSPAGKVIADKEITFGNSVTAPNFMMKDRRDGYLEGMIQVGKKFKITFQKNRDSSPINTMIQPALPVVVDAGFHYFILKNWEALLDGKLLTFNFVVPSIQDFLKFEIMRVTSEKGDPPELIQFKTGVSHFLLKTFMEPILLTYHRNSRQLLEYEGLSNLNNDEGKSHNVRIKMVYQEKPLSLGKLP